MIVFKYLHFTAVAAVIVLIQLSFSVQADEPSCDDYLMLINNKSVHLTFQSCEKTKNAQLRVLVASYSLDGKHAHEVESELNQNFKMPLLKYACCGWYNHMGHGSFVYKSYEVSIRMFSEETILRQREDWPKIPKFHVTATLYLDEP